MHDERLKEIIKSLASGMSVESIAEMHESTVDEIKDIQEQNKSTICEEREWLKEIGWLA